MGKVSEWPLISLQSTSSIKYCSNRADRRLACWSPVSPVIYSLCVFVRVFVWVATIYSAGIRVWAWKNKTLTSKQRWADVVWPEAAAAVCYYSMCVCVCWWRVHLCRQVGNAGSQQWDVKFEACVSTSVHACLRFCTHKNIYLSCVSVISVCVEPEPVNYKGLAVGWNPEEAWFVVCHHGRLGIVRVPGESQPALQNLVYLADWP